MDLLNFVLAQITKDGVVVDENTITLNATRHRHHRRSQQLTADAIVKEAIETEVLYVWMALIYFMI